MIYVCIQVTWRKRYTWKTEFGANDTPEKQLMPQKDCCLICDVFLMFQTLNIQSVSTVENWVFLTNQHWFFISYQVFRPNIRRHNKLNVQTQQHLSIIMMLNTDFYTNQLCPYMNKQGFQTKHHYDARTKQSQTNQHLSITTTKSFKTKPYLSIIRNKFFRPSIENKLVL